MYNGIRMRRKVHSVGDTIVHPFSIKFRKPSSGSCTDVMAYHVIVSDESFIGQFKNEQHGTKNNRSWLSTCSQVIKPAPEDSAWEAMPPLTPCIMCVQYIGGCSVHWGIP